MPSPPPLPSSPLSAQREPLPEVRPQWTYATQPHLALALLMY